MWIFSKTVKIQLIVFKNEKSIQPPLGYVVTNIQWSGIKRYSVLSSGALNHLLVWEEPTKSSGDRLLAFRILPYTQPAGSRRTRALRAGLRRIGLPLCSWQHKYILYWFSATTIRTTSRHIWRKPGPENQPQPAIIWFKDQRPESITKNIGQP